MEWMEAYNVNELGIDVRRFTSFGVIKVTLCFYRVAELSITPIS